MNETDIPEAGRISLRTPREDDFMTCVRLSRAAWPEFKERESIYHLFCRFFASTCLIAEDSKGTVHGFLLGFLSQADSDEAYIHLVAVDSAQRRRGIARKLYEGLFDAAASLGARRVRLIVNPDNAGSLLFHRRMGFVPDLNGPSILLDGVPAVADYNGPGNHMVPFVRQL